MLNVEVRADGSAHISGYVNAVGRDSRPVRTPDGLCVEQIRPGTFAAALRDCGEVRMLVNHDPGKCIASTADGTVVLAEDSIGLKADAVIADEDIIRAAHEGRLKGWSFGFSAPKREMEYRGDKLPRRILTGFTLHEISLIDDMHTPVYDGTSVEIRAREGGVEYSVFTDNVQCRSSHETVIGSGKPTNGSGLTVPKAVPDYSYYEQAIADYDLNEYELRAGLPLTDRHTAMRRGVKREHDSVDDDDDSELRFNPNHDEKGRFSEGKGLTSGGESGIMRDSGDIFKPVTPQAYERISNLGVFGDYRDDELQNAMKHVLDNVKGKEPGTESLALYSFNDISFIDEAISKDADGTIKSLDYDAPYISIHNHASGKTFSLSDVNKLVNYNNCKGIFVIGNNGNMYGLVKGEKYNSTGFRGLLLGKYMGILNLSDEEFLKESENYGIKYYRKAD